MVFVENNEDKTTFKIPYGGKFVKNDIKFDLNDLPNELKQILYKFVVIHCKTMEEEDKIFDITINFFKSNDFNGYSRSTLVNYQESMLTLYFDFNFYKYSFKQGI